MRLTPYAVSLYKRKICRCGGSCRIGVEFRDFTGDVEFTLCQGASKQLAMGIFETLIDRPEVPPLKKHQRWTDKEIRILRARRSEGATQGQIALELGRTPAVVRKKISHLRALGELEAHTTY